MSLATERRALTDAERARAAARAKAEQPRWLALAGISVFLVFSAALLAPCFAGSAVMLLDGLGLQVDDKAALRIFATAAVLVLSWEAWSIHATVARKSQLVAAIENDLAEGVAEVLRVEARAVRRPVDDLVGSPTFLHDLGDGHALCTKGPHLHALVAARRFPCRAFSVVRLPSSKVTLEVVPEGEPLEATFAGGLDALRDGDVVKAP